MGHCSEVVHCSCLVFGSPCTRLWRVDAVDRCLLWWQTKVAEGKLSFCEFHDGALIYFRAKTVCYRAKLSKIEETLPLSNEKVCADDQSPRVSSGYRRDWNVWNFALWILDVWNAPRNDITAQSSAIDVIFRLFCVTKESPILYTNPSPETFSNMAVVHGSKVVFSWSDLRRRRNFLTVSAS